MSQHEHFGYQWAAGLIEGEGCISIGQCRRGESYREIAIRVQMTDEDVIRTLHKVLGCGTVITVQPPGNRKRTWAWRVSTKPDVYKVLLHLRRHMHSRRADKADEALALLAEDDRIKELRE